MANQDPTTVGNAFKIMMGDAQASLAHGAKVAVAAQGRQFCIEILHGLIPGEVPTFVTEHPITKRVEPVIASLAVMFLATYFKAWLPYADKAYWMAKTSLEADGRDIIQPIIARVGAMFAEKLRDFSIPDPDIR